MIDEKCNNWKNYQTWQIWMQIDSNDRDYWFDQGREYINLAKSTGENEDGAFAEALEFNFKAHLGEYEQTNDLAHCLLMNSLEKVDWLEITRFIFSEIALEDESQETINIQETCSNGEIEPCNCAMH